MEAAVSAGAARLAEEMTGDDEVFEVELLRNPYSVRSWMRFLRHKAQGAPLVSQMLVYERACATLPGSEWEACVPR